MLVKKATADLYAEYKTKMEQVADVRNAIAVLSWDQETYLPEKAANFRGQQITTLSTIAHEMFTNEALGILLHELSSRTDMDERKMKNVALSLEDYEKNKKYPAAFVAEMAQTTSACYHAWIKARKLNSYEAFESPLNKMIQLKRQKPNYSATMDIRTTLCSTNTRKALPRLCWTPFSPTCAPPCRRCWKK
ncbi:hypothetical protein MKQ70_34260 [Chitinophaga sedimenti]|nr:hypothetical protein [Chitinophaga sedimenti]MCK7559736.1 hypothetical protein [Chitinophaga sedimenti]